MPSRCLADSSSGSVTTALNSLIAAYILEDDCGCTLEDLVEKVRNKSTRFSHKIGGLYTQEDCSEFLLFLIREICEENRVKFIFDEQFSSLEKLDELFSTLTEEIPFFLKTRSCVYSRLECEEGADCPVSLKAETTLFFNLPLPEKNGSLLTHIQDFLKTESINRDCGNCSSGRARKSFHFRSLPNILPIYVKPMTSDNVVRETKTGFELSGFDLSSFEEKKNSSPALYDLVSVIKHSPDHFLQIC